MQDEQICSVCLLNINDNERCILPGCQHTFHSACVLNFAQYDSRCPVCRQQPEGVVSKREELIPENLQETLTDMRVRWRRYTERRRRFLRQRPHIQQAYLDLKQIRREMNLEVHLAQRTYDRKCREVWRSDQEVSVHKKNLSRMRRRERRLETVINNAIEELGPEPF
jgi:hypothetical protein